MNLGFEASAAERSKKREIGQTVHELKCWPQFFRAIEEGRKTHDLRRSDDRRFRVGDQLLLREYDPSSGTYTGRTLSVEITYITSAELPCALSKDALNPAFAILSIRLLK